MNKQQLLGDFEPGTILNISHAHKSGFVVIEPVSLFIVHDAITANMPEGFSGSDLKGAFLTHLLEQGYLFPNVGDEKSDQEIYFPCGAHIPSYRRVQMFHDRYPWLVELLTCEDVPLVPTDNGQIPVMKALVHLVNANFAHETGFAEHLTSLEPGPEPRTSSLVSQYIQNLSLKAARVYLDLVQKTVIEEQGYSVKGIFSDEKDGQSFAHTVGLAGKHGFELLAVGNTNVNSLALVVDNAACLYQEEAFDLSQIDLRLAALADGTDLRCKYVEVDLQLVLDKYLTERVGEVTKVYQLLVGDKNNILPGESGYDESFNQTL